MSQKRLLSIIDLVFLSLEKRQQPMHVGGLLLFKLPQNNKQAFLQALSLQLKDKTQTPVKPYNQILKGAFWGEDVEFDVEQHIQHVALPSPGRIRELLAYISHEHSALIDKANPLWECHLIEGIEGDRFGLYIKVHHALIDGVGAMKVMQGSLSKDPNETLEKPIWALATHNKNKERKKPKLLDKVSRGFKAVTASGQAFNMIRRELQGAYHDIRFNPDYVSAYNAPKSILNVPISASRRFSAQSYDLVRIKEIANRLGVTVNDVILAMCSGAIRNYLKQRDELPKKPLIAMVPVSFRKEEDDGGNQFSMVLANLATHLSDPLERLQTIHRSMSTAKSRFKRMSQQAIVGYSGLIYALAGVNLVTGAMPKKQAFNLVISNLAGPTQKLYLNGATLEGMYPASIVLDGQAVNITMMSYIDKLEVGIMACRRSLPHIQTLLALLEDELTALDSVSKKFALVPIN